MEDSFFPDRLRELFESAEVEYEFANNAPAVNISHILNELGSSDDCDPTAESDSDDETAQ